jgi:hypothetical protein
MERSTNGWLRLAVLSSAVMALISAVRTIGDFLADIAGGGLRWSAS